MSILRLLIYCNRLDIHKEKKTFFEDYVITVVLDTLQLPFGCFLSFVSCVVSNFYSLFSPSQLMAVHTAQPSKHVFSIRINSIWSCISQIPQFIEITIKMLSIACFILLDNLVNIRKFFLF